MDNEEILMLNPSQVKYERGGNSIPGINRYSFTSDTIGEELYLRVGNILALNTERVFLVINAWNVKPGTTKRYMKLNLERRRREDGWDMHMSNGIFVASKKYDDLERVPANSMHFESYITILSEKLDDKDVNIINQERAVLLMGDVSGFVPDESFVNLVCKDLNSILIYGHHSHSGVTGYICIGREGKWKFPTQDVAKDVIVFREKPETVWR